MSGFKDHVIGILRDNLMLHGESIGWVLESDGELSKELEKRKMLFSADKRLKDVFLLDYVVLSGTYAVTPLVLKAFSLLSKLGIIIIDATGWHPTYIREYVSVFGNFTATPLNYGNRQYLVIHAGGDYGN
jgi:hypothetical protein